MLKCSGRSSLAAPDVAVGEGPDEPVGLIHDQGYAHRTGVDDPQRLPDGGGGGGFYFGELVHIKRLAELR